MDDVDSSSASSGSFPKYLEHLSGDGKAIGVLTSGGDAQGVRLPALKPASQARGGRGGPSERAVEEDNRSEKRGRAKEKRWVM